MYRFVPVVVREMCWGRYAGPWLGCDAAVEGGGLWKDSKAARVQYNRR